MKVHSNLSKASPMCGTNVESNGGEGTGQTEEGDNATDGTVLELKGQLGAFNNLTLFIHRFHHPQRTQYMNTSVSM